MFTGLVECVGVVSAVRGSAPRRLVIRSELPGAEIALGDSVAIDGCCLTVVEIAGDTLHFEAATETLKRTTIGALAVGDRVNLERALRVGDRLGGHLVSGHVDAVGTVALKEQRGSALYLGIKTPDEVLRLTAARGSITLSGVSLTVTDVDAEHLYVGLIPHTLAVTTLDDFSIGSPINLEADLVARYIERLMQGRQMPGPKAAGLSLETLEEHGFVKS